MALCVVPRGDSKSGSNVEQVAMALTCGNVGHWLNSFMPDRKLSSSNIFTVSYGTPMTFNIYKTETRLIPRRFWKAVITGHNWWDPILSRRFLCCYDVCHALTTLIGCASLTSLQMKSPNWRVNSTMNTQTAAYISLRGKVQSFWW